MLEADVTGAPNFIRISLASMRKQHLKTVHQLVTDLLSSESPMRSYKQYFLQCIDIIECKIYRPIPPKSKRKSPENVCSIFFDNKGVEFINLARILRNPDIVSSIPKTPKKFSTPMVTYTLDLPTSCKIFNFNKFVNSLNIDEFLTNPNNLPCECGNSQFTDKHHKHIVTGDLRIIENNSLRKIFTKGPKFRQNKEIDLNKTRDCILGGLKDWYRCIL